MKIQLTIDPKDISDLLCSAFEGGSNYWYFIERFTKPAEMKFRSDPDKVFCHLDYPLNPGGALTICTIERDEINGKKFWELNQASLGKGMQVMAKKFPKHFAAVLTENSDSVTGDVFLQCCLFGEVVFG